MSTEALTTSLLMLVAATGTLLPNPQSDSGDNAWRHRIAPATKHAEAVSSGGLTAFNDYVGRGRTDPLPLVAGNLLVTQPNEVESMHTLVEIDLAQGLLRQALPLLWDGSQLQAIDLEWDEEGRLIVLDFMRGAFLVNRTSSVVEGHWGSSMQAQAKDWRGIKRHGQRVYMVSPANKTIGVFTSEGEWLGLLPLPTDAPLQQPMGIAVESTGALWVADMFTLRKLNSHGQQQVSIPSPQSDLYFQSVTLGPCGTADPQAAPDLTGGEEGCVWVSVVNGGATPPDYMMALSTVAPYHLTRTVNLQVNHTGRDEQTSAPAAIIITPEGSSNRSIYSLNPNSFELGTEHIQVYSLETGAYERGIGGSACGASGVDFLCQSFNGILFVPK